MNSGAIFVVVGEGYVAEARCSASSLRKAMNDIPITLYSGHKVAAGCFDKVIELNKPERAVAEKIKCMMDSPYDRTLLLDSDTYICDEISEIFDLLDQFDMAIAPTVKRVVYPFEGVPKSFPSYNSGVIAFRNTVAVKILFSEWLRLYHLLAKTDGLSTLNEPSLRPALYNSGLRIAVLSDEYHCRPFQMSLLHAKAKILHAHLSTSEWARVAAEINQTSASRLVIGGRVYLLSQNAPQLIADFSDLKQDSRTSRLSQKLLNELLINDDKS